MEAGEGGQPTAVYLSPRRAGGRPGRRYAVEAVLETWRIDDEWWRERPLSRMYYRLLLEDGQVVTVYWEEARKLWARQRY